MKRPSSLPNILIVDEIRKIINSRTDLKHRAIILTIYSCVLRISEVVNLKTNDIDSSAMKVKIDKKMFSMITTK
ncbi:MAG: tyrosine-type recombinase/integrase [Ignavibacteriales bacterium]|nr:tyrosine-type recombinase/integrase [Ignavibacteriales bacterium]